MILAFLKAIFTKKPSKPVPNLVGKQGFSQFCTGFVAVTVQAQKGDQLIVETTEKTPYIDKGARRVISSDNFYQIDDTQHLKSN